MMSTEIEVLEQQLARLDNLIAKYFPSGGVCADEPPEMVEAFEAAYHLLEQKRHAIQGEIRKARKEFKHE